MDEILRANSNPLHRAAHPTHHTPREKDRDPYDGLRPWSAITHGFGVLLAVLGTVLLLLHAHNSGGNTWHFVTFVLYSISMIVLYSTSTLYHCIKSSVNGRIALRKCDHISIYLLIAGTYTPICLIPLRGPWGWSLFGVIWALAAAGIVMTFFWISSPRWVTAGIYIFMGWLAIIAVYPLSLTLPAPGLFWLLTGGVIYTIGGVLYALKWPGRNSPRFGCHEIFHIFIVLGSVCHYLLMYHAVAIA